VEQAWDDPEWTSVALIVSYHIRSIQGVKGQRPAPGTGNVRVDVVSRHSLVRLNTSNEFKKKIPKCL